jgi:hypothetical protein
MDIWVSLPRGRGDCLLIGLEPKAQSGEVEAGSPQDCATIKESGA